MMSLVMRLKQHIRAGQRFADDRSGNVAVMFAMVAVVLMVSIGAAVDIGRWLYARDQTAAAIDAAVLAGGRSLQTNNTDTAAAIATAKSFYNENVKRRPTVTDDTIKFTVVDNGRAITASGSAFIKTPFLQVGNISKLPVLSLTQAQSAKAALQVGGNGGQNLEVSMMLDITGSMAGQKLKDLKDAATDLIDIVVWDDQSKFTSKIALVPFSEDIRLPTSTALTKARGSGLATSKSVGSGNNKTTYYLSDCVVERTGTQKYTDAAPATNQYAMAHYTTDYTGSGSNKKGVCVVPSSADIVPLTSDKTELMSTVTGLTASGGTAGHLGTAWAWYTLSPNWSALWDSSSQPKAYGTENLKKIAILMTDGEYNTQYDSNGISSSETSAANGSSTTQARALCTAMKAKGITVYTVGFQLGGTSSQSYQTLSQCATDSTKFYSADDGDQLKQAFRDIALKLSSLYLSK